MFRNKRSQAPSRASKSVKSRKSSGSKKTPAAFQSLSQSISTAAAPSGHSVDVSGRAYTHVRATTTRVAAPTSAASVVANRRSFATATPSRAEVGLNRALTAPSKQSTLTLQSIDSGETLMATTTSSPSRFKQVVPVVTRKMAYSTAAASVAPHSFVRMPTKMAMPIMDRTQAFRHISTTAQSPTAIAFTPKFKLSMPSVMPSSPALFMNNTPVMIQTKKRFSTETQAEAAESDYQGPPKEDKYELSNFNLDPSLTNSLRTRFNITHLFPIQAEVMIPIQEGRDVLGKSKTGTGKTLAFLLPVIDKILKDPNHRTDPYSVKVLIMEPTRELANQVARELEKLEPRIRSAVVYGGVSYDAQRSALRHGVDVCIATPGRLIDLLNSNSANLSECKTVILDEADEMLKVGFADAIETILDNVAPDRQTVLFSATVPPFIRNIARKYTENPQFIDCAVSSDATPNLITHKACMLPSSHDEVPQFLISLFKMYSQNGRCIIFTDTKAFAGEMETILNNASKNSNFSAALHGDISQSQRENILQRFRAGRINVLVATDVAARGIDIPAVDLVLQIGIPKDIESYVHRSGRTGRAGKKGTCVLCYRSHERNMMGALSAGTGVRFSQVVAEDLNDDAIDTRLVQELESTLVRAYGVVNARVSNANSDNSTAIDASTTFGAAQALTKKLQEKYDLSTLLTASIYDNLMKRSDMSLKGTRFSLLSSTPRHTTIQLTDPRMNVREVTDRISRDTKIPIQQVRLLNATQTSQGLLLDCPDDIVETLAPLLEAGSVDYVKVIRRLPAELFVGGRIGDRGNQRRGGGGGGNNRGGNFNGGFGGGGNDRRGGFNNNRGGRDRDSGFGGDNRGGFNNNRGGNDRRGGNGFNEGFGGSNRW